MFLDFLTVLFLITITAWLVAMVAGATISTPLAFFGDRGVGGFRRLIITGQVIQSVFFAGLVALAAVVYTANRGERTWPYGLCAFLSTYYTMSTHVYEMGQPPTGLRTQVSHPVFVLEGALLGLMVGLVAFVVVYLWPASIGVVPGVLPLVSILVKFSERVSHLWVVRIPLLFVAIGYIFSVGFVALGTPFTAVSMMVERYRARRRPS